ncbi:hypothetical protein PR048_009980 [Dryococelus australis]|uniref:Uncharacterized protein n=1 Tax=Dryococelus australis TaxID=614101 RepID=A0ABQ9I1G7_9NEOP|nr:hypothetical protein PR048_009980 [Dryococelus australis]
MGYYDGFSNDRRYGAVVFIACIRFETSKRKLQHLTFPDFYHCAQAMMGCWTYGENNSEYDDTDLDREFSSGTSRCPYSS